MAVFGVAVGARIQQQMADAGQPHQADAVGQALHKNVGQPQHGLYLPQGASPAHEQPHRALPAGDADLVLPGGLCRLFRGWGRSCVLGAFFFTGQQRAHGTAGIDAKLAARHAQAVGLKIYKACLFTAEHRGIQGLAGKVCLLHGNKAVLRKQEGGVAAGAPFGKHEC